MSFTYAQLKKHMGGRAAGIRIRTELQPMGGPGDKVFPPTYAEGYATEKRVVDGEPVEAVVLDSVASQANRQEEALAEERSRGASIPVVAVDFTSTTCPDLGVITDLEASHRVFDALFRDSLNGDLLFRLSEEGRRVTEATPSNAGGLLELAPSALVFGAWDSTGPKGGLGSKFERAITSEIVATGVQTGVKTSSRIDVLGIEKSGGTIYEAADPNEGWVVSPEDAKSGKKDSPALKGDGRPSEVNHGNIVPTVDSDTGGVTAESITATTVLSFIQLRRLRFPVGADGKPLAEKKRDEAEVAARCALACLGLIGALGASDGGYDLRSRCVLVPLSASKVELIGRTLDDVEAVDLTTEQAVELLGEAVAELTSLGLGWNADGLVLVPSGKLMALIEGSREVAVSSEADGDA